MSLKEIKTKISHYYLNADGNFHGEYKSYYDNGQLRIHCHYNNGEYHGEYKSYWDDGQLWANFHYNNGKRYGEYKAYHDNGQLEHHCHCSNGKLRGEYRRYWDNGQLLRHTYYDVNGEVVHDFLEEDSEFIRTCLYIAHGAPFLT